LASLDRNPTRHRVAFADARACLANRRVSALLRRRRRRASSFAFPPVSSTVGVTRVHFLLIAF
jgi:hypothetical protein